MPSRVPAQEVDFKLNLAKVARMLKNILPIGPVGS